ncbi:hypothetical protein ASPBRDRAFT_51229 [Aspergillus brasiliensis CBS 101740]|uniref:Uncharacterized protein n=1 Tax=Aspergillus brasiliensis (strain CBS 101740 / IMI 381727 / IBT 21946) TaxID=767769 RepID=A0A1L9UUZ9_ASPBC|nr:hypothetical protein ASPBRDRAFT_51229 [Aspergillus brasiliensis CBS 101740]
MGLIPKRAGTILKEGYRRNRQIIGTGASKDPRLFASHDKNTKGRESERPDRYNQSRKTDSSNRDSRTPFHLQGGIRLALVSFSHPHHLVTVTTLGDARARRRHNAQSSLLNEESTQQIRLTSPPTDDLIHSARGTIAIRSSTIRLLRMTCRRLGLAGSLLRGALSSTSAGLDSALVAGHKGNQPMLNDHPPLDPMSEPYGSAGSPKVACSGGYRREAKQRRDRQK